MRTKRFLRFGVGAVAVAAMSVALAGTAAQASLTDSSHAAAAVTTTSDGHGVTAAELAANQHGQPLAPPSGGWDVPSDRSYHLLPSCSQYADVIRQGASAWAGLNETANSGTPVECRNSYIDDCGQGGRIVGCNWGHGQRIALYMGGVGQDALLAAHEFGHDWYGHSSYRCASWSSPAHVMAPSICGFTAQGTKQPIRID